MLTIVVMLIIALIPTMQKNWMIPGIGVYAGCYYRFLGKPHYQVREIDLLSIIISLVVLMAGYITKTIKLFRKKSDFTRWLFKIVPGNWGKRRLDKIYRRSKQKQKQKHHRCGLGRFDRIRYKGELSLLISIKAVLDL